VVHLGANPPCSALADPRGQTPPTASVFLGGERLAESAIPLFEASTASRRKGWAFLIDQPV